METIIQSPHFIIGEKLKAFAETKAAKLLKYDDRIVKCEMILKLNKADDDKNKICEISIYRQQSQLFASAQCLTFEDAINETIRSIEKQLKKNTAKMRKTAERHTKISMEAD